jgi:osmotically-inducible protein OsmY
MTIAKRIATALFAVSLAATFVGCASTSSREGTGEYIDDSVITTKVKAAIINEQGFGPVVRFRGPAS